MAANKTPQDGKLWILEIKVCNKSNKFAKVTSLSSDRHP